MADFQAKCEQFKSKNIRIIAASVDSKEDALGTVRKHDLELTVAYGLDARATSQTLGTFFEDEKGFLQPANFIINPEGKVYISVYSSGAIGRFRAAECLDAIDA